MTHRYSLLALPLMTLGLAACDERDMCRDADGDGYESCSDVPGLVDCDDTDPTVHPRADEIACDGIDQDCDGGDFDPSAVAWTLPADGEADVHVRTFVNANFEDVDDPDDLPEVTLHLASATGEVVAGDLSMLREEVWFTPHTELSPQGSYTATLTVGQCPSHEWSFDTGESGLPVDPTPAVGGDYYIDHMSGRVSSPLSMGGLIEAFAEEIDVALHVTGVDEASGTFEAFSAVVDLDHGVLEQDLCEPTSPWAPQPGEAAAWDNPHFHTDGFAFTFGLDEGPDGSLTGRSQGVLASGTVSADGEHIDGLRLDEMVEMELLEAIYASEDDMGACELFASLGEPCVACPDGSGPHCMNIVFEMIDAPRTEVETLDPETGEVLTTLVEVTEEDVQRRVEAGICP